MTSRKSALMQVGNCKMSLFYEDRLIKRHLLKSSVSFVFFYKEQPIVRELCPAKHLQWSFFEKTFNGL